MNQPKITRALISQAKYLFDNGDQLTGSVYNKIVLTGVFIGSFRDFFNSFGVPIWLLCVMGITFILFGNMLVGYINLRHGILKQYNNAGWYNCDVAMQLVRENNAMYKKFIEEQEKEKAKEGENRG